MKKYLFAVLAVLAIVSCSRWDVTTECVSGTPDSFDYVFTVAEKPSFEPGTRAVKSSWEDGDKIYIVFDDVMPHTMKDFMILKYNGQTGDWDVVQEPSTAPNAAGGTLDALYYENPNPDGLFTDTVDGGCFLMDSDRGLDGQYLYHTAENVAYKVEGGKVLSQISLDFIPNNVRTFVQFRVSGLEGDWELFLWDQGASGSTVSFAVWAPTWEALNKCFQYQSSAQSKWRMNPRADGHYLYLSVLDRSESVTIGLHKTSGEHAGYYYKTFAKTITGKAVAITFQGPQFDASGVTTNGWTSLAMASGTLDGHDYVDLGSDVLWATTNVGAAAVDASGDFYAWGEVEPYYSSLSPLVWKAGKEAGYGYLSYRFWEVISEGVGRLTKYNSSTDKEDLESSDDAAACNWGGKWRMPTATEWSWMRSNCTFELIKQINCVKVTSTVSGYEGNSILVPVAGCFNGTRLYANMARYWASTSIAGQSSSYGADVSNTGITFYAVPRPYGMQIRAVAPKE